MTKTPNDQFVFRQPDMTTKRSDKFDPLILSTSSRSNLNEEENNEKSESMQDRKKQIDALNSAKKDVERKLNAIFEEECLKLVGAIDNMYQVDDEKLIHFLMQTLYMRLKNEHIGVDGKPRFYTELIAAFDGLGTESFSETKGGWMAAEHYPENKNETRNGVDAA